MSLFDVIIVGAGPAGSTLAAFLGRRGIATLVVDKETFPRDKVCGEYMSPEALRVLDRIGVLGEVEAQPHRKLYGILLHSYDGTQSRGTYRPVGSHEPYRPYGLAIRRRIFDSVLLDHARSFPSVTVLEGFRVDDLLREDGKVVGIRGSRGEHRARVVIGADGVRSVVARCLGLSEFARDHEKFALAAYWRGMEHEDYGELHLGTPGYFALAPVERDLVNINFVVDRKSLEGARGNPEGFYRSHLQANPRLRSRLRKASLASSVRVTGPMARRCRGTAAPGALLIGDAAEFVDPFTGEGLFIAMRSAELAEAVIAEALQRGDVGWDLLRKFSALRAAEFGERLKMCWRIQRFLYRPWLANLVIRRLAFNPDLADRVTAVTGDYVPPGEVITLPFYWTLFNPLRSAYAAR